MAINSYQFPIGIPEQSIIVFTLVGTAAAVLCSAGYRDGETRSVYTLSLASPSVLFKMDRAVIAYAPASKKSPAIAAGRDLISRIFPKQTIKVLDHTVRLRPNSSKDAMGDLNTVHTEPSGLPRMCFLNTKMWTFWV